MIRLVNVVIRRFLSDFFSRLKLYIFSEKLVLMIGFIRGEMSIVLMMIVVELIFNLMEVIMIV